MNKRIKIKRGLSFKKCDEKCWIYREIVGNKLMTNNACIGCVHKSVMDMKKENTYKDISNSKFCEWIRQLNEEGSIKGYPYFENNMCFGVEITSYNGTKENHINCMNCEWHYTKGGKNE